MFKDIKEFIKDSCFELIDLVYLILFAIIIIIGFLLQILLVFCFDSKVLAIICLVLIPILIFVRKK